MDDFISNSLSYIENEKEYEINKFLLVEYYYYYNYYNNINLI